ncbi:MAG: hypothetical protein U9N30_07705 [Campylobacterota bacterium]|nr:hypothetical protein [Campylobacterota bacterium]
MRDYFSKNIEKIKTKAVMIDFYSDKGLYQLIEYCKENNLISKSMSYSMFYDRALNELNMSSHTVSIKGKIKTRYTFLDGKKFNVYKFAESLESKSFFSMSTALNIQDISTFRNDFIFISKISTPKYNYNDHNQLTQDSIDSAFKKAPRKTKNYGTKDGKNIVILEPKSANMNTIINFNGYKVSSINRTFIEMIVNVQYFKSPKHLIDLFINLKDKIDPKRVCIIIENFDFIYPYQQLAGFYLEKVGFSRKELTYFKKEVKKFKFYTQKAKSEYQYDSYWQIYY